MLCKTAKPDRIFHCALKVRAQSFEAPQPVLIPQKNTVSGIFQIFASPFPAYAGLIFSGVYISTNTMSTKARVAKAPGTPVAAPRTKARSLSGRGYEMPISPVQRMRQKIALADPELVRRIISDPALEP